MTDDSVGWDAVDPEFVKRALDQQKRARDLTKRIAQVPAGSSAAGVRVTLYQLLRETGVLADDWIFYLIAWELALLASERAQQDYLENFAPRLRPIYSKYGLDMDDLDAWEDWTPPDPYPEELARIEREMEGREEKFRAAVYREFGEEEMARLYLEDEAEFWRRWKAGEAMVHGPDFREQIERKIREYQGQDDQAGEDSG